MSRSSQNVDVLIGSRVRLRRQEVQMSQEGLASRLGLTFQQVQKYEKGTNRISASRLFHIAKALNVPVSYFFEDLQSAAADQNALATRADNTRLAFSPEAADLLRLFSGIRHREVRQALLTIARSVSTMSETPESAVSMSSLFLER